MSELAPVGDTALVSAEEARALTDQIKTAVEVAWHLVMQAYKSRAWVALGYSSWDDYCTREFGTSRLRLPREDRQEVVASLRESGMSVRAITAATGASRRTVQTDLKEVAQSSPPQVAPRFKESQVKGTDGKTYPSTTERIARAKENNPAADPPRNSRAAVEARVAKAREMAEQGYTSSQIAGAIGIDRESFSGFRARHNLEVPADAVVGKPRLIDSNRVVNETAIALEGLVMGLGLVEASQLNPEQIAGWATSLSNSLRSLNRFHKQLKEMAHDG